MEVRGSTRPQAGSLPPRGFPPAAATSRTVEGVDSKCTWYNSLIGPWLVHSANMDTTTCVWAGDTAIVALLPSFVLEELSRLVDLINIVLYSCNCVG